jgi:cytoskeletal protein RodZ
VGVSADNARPLGEWLRQRREELGISLEQAEADTRIRRCYLEALESEEFDALPDAVVGRGFLRNYAVYLELDPKAASDRYSEIVAPPQPESVVVEGPTPFTEEPFRPVALHEMPGRRSRWVWVAGAALILVAVLSLLAWWGYPRFSGWLAQREPTNSPVAATSTQQVKEGDLSTATHTPSSTAAATSAESEGSAQATPTLELTLTPTTTPSPSPTPSPSVYTGIFLELVLTDTSWIQVTVDGVREFQGELEAETYRSWYGEERIELRIGNAGAVLVTVNGQSLGTLGGPDEVIDRVFEKVDGSVAEATVTSTPTVDQTTEPTEAPTPRPTSVPPTATIAPTAIIAPTEPITPTATMTPTVAITATASP